MKLISWNCNGAFRNKYHALNDFNADIWVIPESESHAYLGRHNSPLQSVSGLWCGNNHSKGLGVFAFNGYHIRTAAFFNPEFKYILPVTVTAPDNTEFLLIAVWASRVQTNPDWDYIGQLCYFMEHYASYLTPNTILVGDFNINMLWNKSFKKEHNYTRFLELCRENGFCSLYHELTQQPQGQETAYTSYFHHNPLRGFHIDYAYLNRQQLPNVKSFKIHGCEWLAFSDHTVLELELSPPAK